MNDIENKWKINPDPVRMLQSSLFWENKMGYSLSKLWNYDSGRLYDAGSSMAIQKNDGPLIIKFVEISERK